MQHSSGLFFVFFTHGSIELDELNPNMHVVSFLKKSVFMPKGQKNVEKSYEEIVENFQGKTSIVALSKLLEL